MRLARGQQGRAGVRGLAYWFTLWKRSWTLVTPAGPVRFYLDRDDRRRWRLKVDAPTDWPIVEDSKQAGPGEGAGLLR